MPSIDEVKAFQDWLANLKPGDEVAIYYRTKIYGQRTVVRRTKTQIIVSGVGPRYKASNGGEIGNPFGLKIRPITPQSQKEIHQQQVRNDMQKVFNDFRLGHLTTEEMEVMLQALTTYREPPHGENQNEDE